MLPKNPTNSLHSKPQFSPKGHPYTKYPVPIEPQPQAHWPQKQQKENNQDSNEYQYPTNPNYDKNFKLMSADCKFRRTPGLVNFGRKINFNGYDQERVYGEAEGIRRFGMDYRRKLQNRYNSSKINVYNSRLIQTAAKNSKNYDREMKNWYEERTQNFNKILLQYLKKFQIDLARQEVDRANIQQVASMFDSANKQWQQQILTQLKKCFET